jgi:hypothetical protein
MRRRQSCSSRRSVRQSTLARSLSTHPTHRVLVFVDVVFSSPRARARTFVRDNVCDSVPRREDGGAPPERRDGERRGHLCGDPCIGF